eukprot:TRINITY_DN10829_c0_g1_i1.p1 TRINITY_DN10829_c0_g1~~TRINITY_DN10829_c0_g1_i1.p1  ORF type:complete len:334 (-),score=12.36 TRINITY_DN10829_c0_g1_i1:122-1123(-)
MSSNKELQVIFEREKTPHNQIRLPKLPLRLLDYLDFVRIRPESPKRPSKFLKRYTIFLGVRNSLNMFGLKKRNKKREFFGVVKLCHDFTAEVRAHERLDPLNCPYIIKMYEAIELTKYEGLIITPLYNTFDFHILHPFTKLVGYQLLQAIKVCHDNIMVHRDVKPDNIVWSWDGDKPHIYLTDFGISTPLHNSHDNGMARGTYAYMSPEMYNMCLSPDGEDRPFDIWGAGLVLTELLLNRPRMLKEDRQLIKWHKKKAKWFRDIDPNAYDLVLKMLEEDPTKRILADDALAHPYFDDIREKENEGGKKRKLDRISNESAAQDKKKQKTKDDIN